VVKALQVTEQMDFELYLSLVNSKQWPLNLIVDLEGNPVTLETSIDNGGTN